MFTYLAGPYSCAMSPRLEELRAMAHADALARLMKEDLAVFSPIVQGYVVKDMVNWGLEEWLKFDIAILAKCDLLIVLTIDGWDASIGVQTEIQYAKDHDMTIRYIDPKFYVHPDTLSKMSIEYAQMKRLTS